MKERKEQGLSASFFPIKQQCFVFVSWEGQNTSHLFSSNNGNSHTQENRRKWLVELKAAAIRNHVEIISQNRHFHWQFFSCILLLFCSFILRYIGLSLKIINTSLIWFPIWDGLPPICKHNDNRSKYYTSIIFVILDPPPPTFVSKIRGPYPK